MKTQEIQVIKEISWPEKVFAIKRAVVSFDKLSDFFKKNYDAIYGELGKQGLNLTDPPCAFYYRIDEAKQETDLAAAVPVPYNPASSESYEVLVLPPCKLVTRTHFGPYEQLAPVYEEMDAYVRDHGFKKGLVIEEYLTDPLIEKDSGKWQTNIYFVVKK
jgi:effector-binding domain-containing protein